MVSVSRTREWGARRARRQRSVVRVGGRAVGGALRRTLSRFPTLSQPSCLHVSSTSATPQPRAPSALARTTRPDGTKLTGPIPHRAPDRAHPARHARNDSTVGQDERQRDAADEEAAREEVAKVDRPARIVLRAKVLGRDALPADEVGQGRERKDGRCVGREVR